MLLISNIVQSTGHIQMAHICKPQCMDNAEGCCVCSTNKVKPQVYIDGIGVFSPDKYHHLRFAVRRDLYFCSQCTDLTLPQKTELVTNVQKLIDGLSTNKDGQMVTLVDSLVVNGSIRMYPSITYVVGDAMEPHVNDSYGCMIVHICNDVKRWGKGFVLGLWKKWPNLRKAYMGLPQYTLGTVQTVEVEPGIIVGNMIAQHGINRSGEKTVRVSYDHLRECLREVRGYAMDKRLSVHMPRIGTGLGGGDWLTVEKIVVDELHGLRVFVYDL